MPLESTMIWCVDLCCDASDSAGNRSSVRRRRLCLRRLEETRGAVIQRALDPVKIWLTAHWICSSLDNSEWMRNGDYVPSRLEAQHDATNLLCGTKTQSNPESTVGILTMAGNR